jgi:4-amino-4-deoxy-L-arabinose transferase-like glycosyltransferase
VSAPLSIDPPRRGLTHVDRLLILAVSFAALLPGVFGVSLFDRDEGWYAQVSREMARSGDWVVPTYLGKPWLAKPPLLYWCVAAVFKLFGAHAAAARMVSVLASVASVQILATIAAQMFTRRAAIIAAISFVTALLPAIVGKLVLTDPLLLLAILFAAERLVRIVVHGPTWGRTAAFWAAIGVAMLAKGPAVFLFIGALGGALLLMPGFRPALLSRQFWLIAPLALAIAATWYGAAYLRSGPLLSEQFFGHEIAARLVGAPHGHRGPPGYFLLVLLAGACPWTVLAPGAVIEAFAARKKDAAGAVALLWLVIPWLILELIPSKLPHYVLPCFAPLSLLLGRMWDIALSRPVEKRLRPMLIALANAGIVLGVGMAACALLVDSPAYLTAAACTGAAVAVGFGLVLRLVLKDQWLMAWQTTVLTSLLLIGGIGIGVLPALEGFRLSRSVSARINTLAAGGRSLAACETLEPTVFFYSTPDLHVISVDNLHASVAEPDCHVIVARERDWNAAGMPPIEGDARWEQVEGFNYVKGAQESVWFFAPGADVVPGSETAESPE